MTERISQADTDGGITAQPVCLADRFLGALLAMFGVSLSVLLCPMILYWNLDPTGFWLFFGRTGFNYWLILWSIWSCLVASAIGFAIGYDRTLSFMSHLWFTADAPDRQFSMLLWIGLLALGAATFFILSAIPASSL